MKTLPLGLFVCATIALLAIPAATADATTDAARLVDHCLFHAHDAAVDPVDETDDHAWADVNRCLAGAGAPTVPIRTDVDLQDGRVVASVSHEFFLGGGASVEVGPEGIAITHQEGITVCWTRLAFDPLAAEYGCAY